MCRLSGSSVEEARDLIARGINVDEQNDYQCTALHWAVDKGRIDIVRELIRAGAALDVKDWVGRTARQIAQVWDHDDVVALLEEVETAADTRNVEVAQNVY